MPLLNLGYGLSGLTQGYNQAQQQAMQLAAQRLALQQAQSQQNAQRLASQYLQSGGLKGLGGGFGGGFNPANIQPIGGQQPAPIPGVTTPSQAPAPPSQQQPPSTPGSPSTAADAGIFDYNDAIAAQKTDQADQATPSATFTGVPGQAPLTGRTVPLVEGGKTYPPGVMSPSELNRWHESKEAGGGSSGATSAPSGTTTPDKEPAPGPSDAAPASTTSEATGSTGGDASGEGYAIKIPGGPSIPLAQFFGSVDYGQIAQGISKIAPPGTDQADIYQAVVDLSKLAEGNKTQQQQAGLILRELIKQPFDLEKIDRRAAGQANVANIGAASREKVANIGAASREKVGAAHDEVRREAIAASTSLRQQSINIATTRENRLAQAQADRLRAAAQNMGLKYELAQLTALARQRSTIVPKDGVNYDKTQQAQLKAIGEQEAAIGERIAAQAAAPAPAAQ